MRTARPLGLTPDGTSLLVVTSDGEHIAVTADERLRAAIRDDRARLGQLEIDMESSLRPREIQARIRAGESLEEVARDAGMPVERVQAFAGPVIAEREHVVGLALAAPVRRRGETAATRALRATVAERLLGRGIDVDDVDWDSWKRPDGVWTVQASYASGAAEHLARFAYDLRGRFSTADNDDARWLIGESGTAHGPQPGRRRRSVDPDNEPTVDLDDELALVRATMGEPDESSAWHAAADEAEVPDYAPAELEEVDGIYDLVPPKTEMDVLYDMISGIDEDSVRIYTGLSRPVTQEPRDEPEQLSLIDLVDDEPTHIASRAELAEAAAAAAEPPAAAAAAEALAPTPAEPDDIAEGTPARPGGGEPTSDAHIATTGVTDGEESDAALSAKPPVKRRRSKRASVPSWDEIMFGGPTPK